MRMRMRVGQVLTIKGCRASFRDASWLLKRYRIDHGEKRWWRCGAQMGGVIIILAAIFRRKIVFETKTCDG